MAPVLGSEDLIAHGIFIHRSRYYTFEEFLLGWYEKLKQGETTTMVVFLQQEIEKFKVR